MSDSERIDIQVDARGLRCPEPLVRTRLAMARVPAGGLVEVLTTDPMAELDFKVFCQRGRHTLIVAEAGDDHQRFVLRKA